VTDLQSPPPIVIPEEVRPLYLVDLPTDLPPVYAEAREVFARYRTLPYRTLLAQAELLYQDAWSVRDRHIAALARLYQADLYQRLGKLHQALKASQMSAKWLALHVPVHARYQEAVARYFSGILWYLADEPERAMRSLNAAANLLAEARRAWRYSGGHPYLPHCERLARWIADLLALRVRAWQQPNITILPVYIWCDENKVELDGATAVDKEKLLPSVDETSIPLTNPISVTRSEDELPDSDMYYFAVKVAKAQKIPRTDIMNLVYVEAEPAQDATSPTETEDRIPFEFITGKVQGKLIIGREDE
jgi:tetratricopeptide (TPR) repeat protein